MVEQRHSPRDPTECCMFGPVLSCLDSAIPFYDCTIGHHDVNSDSLVFQIRFYYLFYKMVCSLAAVCPGCEPNSSGKPTRLEEKNTVCYFSHTPDGESTGQTKRFVCPGPLG